MDIGEKLQKIMVCAEWSQTQLAQRLSVPQKTVSFWITARSLPRVKNIEAIDRLYNDIVGGDDEVAKNDLALAKSQAAEAYMSIDDLAENSKLFERAAVQLTYHTNTIEGSTMTLDDVKLALSDENAIIKDRSVREQVETRNHRAALKFLLDELRRPDFKWTVELICDIHLHLMNGIMESAGKLRNYSVRLLGSPVPLANYLSLPVKLGDLADRMNVDSDDLIAFMAKTHAEFEQLHPFGDGNGRTGRLVMFGQALRSNMVPPLIIKERKNAYYKYLRKAQLGGECQQLELLIAESILEANKIIEGGNYED